MPLYLITAPTSEPVTLQEVKEHARVEIGDDNAYLEGLITKARVYAEGKTHRQFITATWRQTLDCFPERIDLPRPPLATVTSITYVDSNGATQTLDASQYQTVLDPEGGYIVSAYGTSWPATRGQPEAVTVNFTAGSTVALAPAQAKHAIAMLVSHWYEVREPAIVGTIVAEAPWAVEQLLNQICVRSFV